MLLSNLAEISPTHTYTLTGTFAVTLTVSVAPLEVHFTNLSYGDYDGSAWDFGDGETSTAENPTHTYRAADAYTVTLAVSGPGGSDTERKVNYIRVGESDAYNLYVPLILRGD